MKKPRIAFRVESYVDPCSQVLPHIRDIMITQRDLLIFENKLYKTTVYGTTAEEAQREVDRCYAILNAKYSTDPKNNPLPIVITDKSP